MGTFTTQPATTGASAVYHPIKYTFQHDSTLAVESLRCLIEVKDGALSPTTFPYTIRIPYTSKTLLSGTTYRYIFNIDVSTFCKQKLPPFTYQVSSAFRFGVVDYGNIDNPDFWAQVRVTGTAEYRNAQGILTDDTGAATSNWSTVLPASYRRGDTKNLNSYVTTGLASWLTKRPLGINNTSKWCLNSENTLSIYFPNKKITSTKTIILDYESYPTPTVYNDLELFKYNTGQMTVNLNTLLNTLATTYPSVSTWRIGIGEYTLPGSTFTRLSQFAYINIDRNCCTGYTFSWLNELGGVDSYTFCGEAEIEMQTQNEFGQQYDDGITTRLKGYYKTDTVVGEVIQIRDLLSAADVDWIKYILSSHEVYVKIGSNWYNTVILDATAITESNVQGMFDFSFTARLSDVVTNHN